MAALSTYRERFRYVRLDRQDGILLIQLHQDGGPAVWTAGADGIHGELGMVSTKLHMIRKPMSRSSPAPATSF